MSDWPKAEGCKPIRLLGLFQFSIHKFIDNFIKELN